MMIDGLQICATCRCAVKREDDNEYLECHRHSVSIVGFADDEEAVSAFPVVEPENWCFEYVSGEQ